jgi:hypothetical protein
MKQKIDDNFIALRYKMIKSPAYKALSPYAHAILALLEIEYAGNGGRENGNLICTYHQMKEWCGANTESIRCALAELEAFGFITIRRGRPGTKGYGRAARYGLTYLPKIGDNKEIVRKPTDQWAKITTKCAKGIAAELKNRERALPSCVQADIRSTYV